MRGTYLMGPFSGKSLILLCPFQQLPWLRLTPLKVFLDETETVPSIGFQPHLVYIASGIKRI